jgi:hypothetical protein
MGCSASKVPEDAPVLTKAVEAQAALPKALSAEDVDAMWAKNCGSDSPASDEAAGGGDGGGVMSGVKAISSAAADGAALVKAGVASGLQAVFGEEMDKSDAGPEKAKGGIGSVVDAGVDATVGGVKAIGDGAAYLGQKSLEGFGAIGEDAIKANPLKAFGIGAAATGATVLAVVTAPVTLPAAAAVTVVVGAHATVAAAVGVGVVVGGRRRGRAAVGVGAAGTGAAVVVGTQHGASGSSAADSVAAAENAADRRYDVFISHCKRCTERTASNDGPLPLPRSPIPSLPSLPLTCSPFYLQPLRSDDLR